MTEKLLGLGAAATLAGVAESTINRWVRKGFLPVSRTPTGKRKFRIEDIRRAVELARPPRPIVDDQHEIKAIIARLERMLCNPNLIV